MDKVGVGAEERGCVGTASLCGYCGIFQCLASSSFHIDFFYLSRERKGKIQNILSKSFSFLKFKQQI